MRQLPFFMIVFLTLAADLLGVTPAAAQTPGHLWGQDIGTATDERGFDVAVDASGNIYVTGQFFGTTNLGGANLVSLGSGEVFVAKYNSLGVHQWSQRFGGTSSDGGTSVAVDAAGNVLVAGFFQGTANFGGVDLVSGGSTEIFLARYNSSGTHVWSQRFGSTFADEPMSIAVDSGSNILVTGYFGGTVSFGGAGLVSAGGFDAFVAKYNSSGTHLWSQRFGGTASDLGLGIAVDGTNVLVSGYFSLTANFGGANLVSAGSADVFIAKYNSSGTHQWSQRFGGIGSDEGNKVAVDASGNVVATGIFASTVNFGGATLVSAGNDDIFLAKFNSAGVHQWSQRFGSTNIDTPEDVAVDPAGNVLMSGSFSGPVSFGGSAFTSVGAATDMFMAKYNSAGVHKWSRRAGNTSADDATAIAVDASGNVLVTGYCAGTVNLGGVDLAGPGLLDMVLAKYSYDSAEPVLTSIADIGNDQGRKVKLRFTRSGSDDPLSTIPVMSYEAYRRDDAPPALTSAADPAAMSPRELAANGWSFVGSAPAHNEATYGFDVPTIGDSTITLGQYYSVFYVRASTDLPRYFYDSKADSGYSRDNLAPAVPQNFVFTAGQLSWNESTAKDFDYFTVYGSNADSFGASTVVNYSVSSALNVVASPYVYYYVTATDFSGNEGKPARVNTLSGVGETPRSYVLSVSNYPNPFNPRTTVTYTAPSPGEVKVHIYDARGAIVKTLFEGHRVAGAYSVDWDGRADNGDAVASGLYFVRIEHASGVRSKKMVLLK